MLDYPEKPPVCWWLLTNPLLPYYPDSMPPKAIIPGQGEPCRVIAEIGTAHGGDKDHGRRLIDAAALSGCDCVKFQLVYAEEIIHPASGKVRLPGGEIPLFEKFKSLEREISFFLEMKVYTEKCGLIFLCTPFGLGSARAVRNMGVRAIKIASPELNHLPLLEEVSGYGLPLLLSCGVSTLGDIETALAITGEEVVLLHCVTQYPAPEEEYNLRLLPNLAGIFGVKTGVSDHSLHPVLVPALSAALGAAVLEKHITLSREGDGLDDPVALEPEAFKKMVHGVRLAEQEGREETCARLGHEYGNAIIERILGSGVKKLAPSEAANYLTTNRSILALSALTTGEVLGPTNMAILRSEKNLTPGLHPRYWPLVCGKILKRPLAAGEGINWEHIL